MSAENPLVHRAVRTGGIFLAAASVQFVVAALLVESHYPGFGAWTTSLTSLGSSASPWAIVFNASLMAFGVLAIVGLLFAWSAFDEHRSRVAGLLLLMVSSLGVFCAGAFGALASRLPSNAVTGATYLAVGAAGVGFLVVAFAMHRHERWRISRAYTFATGLTVLVGAAFSAVPMLGVSPDVAERVALGVGLLWAVIEGMHIALLHRFARGLPLKVATA